MERRLICPCGLTCCDCLFYKTEIYDAAKRLRDLIKKDEFDYFLNVLSNKRVGEALGKHFMLSENESWDKLGKCLDIFKQMPEFMNVLNGIIELQCTDTCQDVGGCSMAGNTKECIALKCVKSRGFEGCWKCEELENCDKLNLLKTNYGYVIEDNLRIIKEKGIDAVQSRGNQYYAWQRRKS